MTQEELLEKMRQSIINGEKTEAADLAKVATESGISPLKAIDHGFAKGIQEMGKRFDREECYLPELVMAADAMIAAMDVLEEAMKDRAERPKTIGRAIAGTVHGDIHDIGKNIVCTLFTINGFEVLDLGTSVPATVFVQKVDEFKPDLLLMSALLTNTMPGQREVLNGLKQAGLRDKVKVIIGGAPVSQEWADEIGADGFGKNAPEGVNLAKELLGLSQGFEKRGE